MEIIITATPDIAPIDGVPCRRWEGVTERGTKCHVFVHRIAVHNSEDSSQFEAQLSEMPAPSVSDAKKSIAEIFELLDNQVLVRNGDGDHDMSHFTQQALLITTVLQRAKAAMESP